MHRLKEKQVHVENLMKLIQTLETTHKQTWAIQTLQEPISVKKELLNEPDRIVRRNYVLTEK